MISTRSGNLRRRRLAAVGLLVVGLLGFTSLHADAQPRDEVSVAGYDKIVTRASQVIAGSQANNLVFDYVATSALRDGTLTLDVPLTAWPDPLRHHDGPLGGTPAEYGSVVVRPLHPYENADSCRAEPITWTVTRLSTVQRIVVEHLDCDAGERFEVRIFGIAAPQTAGVYRFPISVTDAGETRRVPTPTLRVVRPPRVQLEISVPAQVQYDVPVTVVVRALRPGGRVDTSYRGGVVLESYEGKDCVFDGGYADDVYDFTAADAGERRFSVAFISSPGRLVARDVGREALPGVSNEFGGLVFPEDPILVCPISFH